MKFAKFSLFFMIAALMSACGGGGGDAGTSGFGTGSGGTGTGTGTGTVTGASLIVSISSTTASATSPSTVTATLTDSTGAALSGQVVKFSTSGGLGAFNVNSALTDSNGQAVVKLSPAASSSNGADLVVATATVGTTALTGTIGFQVSPSNSTVTVGAPSITVSISSTAITATTPATLTAVVRDATGAPIAGQVVTFTTAAGSVGAFSVPSALTDSTGTVTTRVAPASSGANGADLAIAQSTISGALVTGSIGFSVTSTGSTAGGAPSISLALSTTTVTTATPATVTAIVRDATGSGVAGQVVQFSTVDGLGSLAVTSALTDATGSASTTLATTSTTQSGADQVVAKTTVNGTALQASQGFQLTVTSVTIDYVASDLPAGSPTLSAYGQTGIHVHLKNAIAGTPVTVAITSGCAATGKAILTPSTATTTSGIADFTYRDNGCGATTDTDTLQASITGSASTAPLALTIAPPTANSITFVSASPTSIYLKGSGYAETSNVIFKVLDTAGNGLPGQSVQLKPTTSAGGLTVDGVVYSDPLAFETKVSDSNGQVSVLVNSGTIPTPVRIVASLTSPSTITTVSSSLSIAVGLPSQLNFSLSQGTRNIEGFNIDGTKNTYSIIASDRLGNPVPAGTSINFIAEGGQVVQNAFTTIDTSGNARATANFISSTPRPADGRITVLAYALGEESFIDLNGTNVYAAGDPFQDLGDIYLDRLYNNFYNSNDDQFISTSLSGNTSACAAIPPAYQSLLKTDVSIPSRPGTCDGVWGKAYVRRAVETVLSTSDAYPLWYSAPGGLYGGSCVSLIVPPGYSSDASETPITGSFIPLLGAGLSGVGASSTYSFLVADSNTIRLNPMAAGTTIAAAATTGVTATILGGTPVPNTSEASFATFSVAFATGTNSGTVTLIFTSPGGLATAITIPVLAGGTSASAVTCP